VNSQRIISHAQNNFTQEFRMFFFIVRKNCEKKKGIGNVHPALRMSVKKEIVPFSEL
jgi:hypothetical protein